MPPPINHTNAAPYTPNCFTSVARALEDGLAWLNDRTIAPLTTLFFNGIGRPIPGSLQSRVHWQPNRGCPDPRASSGQAAARGTDRAVGEDPAPPKLHLDVDAPVPQVRLQEQGGLFKAVFVQAGRWERPPIDFANAIRSRMNEARWSVDSIRLLRTQLASQASRLSSHQLSYLVRELCHAYAISHKESATEAVRVVLALFGNGNARASLEVEKLAAIVHGAETFCEGIWGAKGRQSQPVNLAKAKDHIACFLEQAPQTPAHRMAVDYAVKHAGHAISRTATQGQREGKASQGAQSQSGMPVSHLYAAAKAAQLPPEEAFKLAASTLQLPGVVTRETVALLYDDILKLEVPDQDKAGLLLVALRGGRHLIPHGALNASAMNPAVSKHLIEMVLTAAQVDRSSNDFVLEVCWFYSRFDVARIFGRVINDMTAGLDGPVTSTKSYSSWQLSLADVDVAGVADKVKAPLKFIHWQLKFFERTELITLENKAAIGGVLRDMSGWLEEISRKASVSAGSHA